MGDVGDALMYSTSSTNAVFRLSFDGTVGSSPIQLSGTAIDSADDLLRSQTGRSRHLDRGAAAVTVPPWPPCPAAARSIQFTPPDEPEPVDFV